MKIIGIALLVLIAAILSRGRGVPTQNMGTSNNAAVMTFTDGNNPASQVTQATGIELNPAHGQPGHRCDIAVGQPLSNQATKKPSMFLNPLTIPTNVAPATTLPADGLNPPHGKPGHRCDIQVGQPLNSKSAQAPAPTTTSTPTTLTTPTTPNTTSTVTSNEVAPGMNPRHGQPGHRCDILVGQPLNSKPSQPAAAATAPKTTTTYVPPVTAPKTNTTYVAPGMNPKHGQPGHRCDILVGQPLNTPVQTANQATSTANP